MREQADPNDIIRTLADKLPEGILEDIFPNTDPQTVRGVLRSLSNKQTGRAKSETSARKKAAGPRQTGLPFASPGTTEYALYTDGASRGNPGEAGAGAVLFDDKGTEIATCSKYLGKCTNNAAEYQALIAGLETALDHGCPSLRIFLDSELIVRQVEGRYKVKNEQLKPLFAKVRTLLTRFTDWQIGHVPRAQNARADELANSGIDNRAK